MIGIATDPDSWTAITASSTVAGAALGKAKLTSGTTEAQIQMSLALTPVIDWAAINHLRLKLDCSGASWDFKVYAGSASSATTSNCLRYDDPTGSRTEDSEITLDIDTTDFYEAGDVARDSIAWLILEFNYTSGASKYGTIRSSWLENMYCKSADLAELMGRSNDGSDFSSSTQPTKVQVNDMIARAMGRVDAACWDSWRPNLEAKRYYNVSTPLDLGRSPIQSLAGVYYYDGASSYDSKTSSSARSTGYDCWLDRTHGLLHFEDSAPTYDTDGLYLSYIWGRKKIPADIEQLTMLYVYRDLCISEGRHRTQRGGTDMLGMGFKVRELTDEIDAMLLRRRRDMY